MLENVAAIPLLVARLRLPGAPAGPVQDRRGRQPLQGRRVPQLLELLVPRQGRAPQARLRLARIPGPCRQAGGALGRSRTRPLSPVGGVQSRRRRRAPQLPLRAGRGNALREPGSFGFRLVLYASRTRGGLRHGRGHPHRQRRVGGHHDAPGLQDGPGGPRRLPIVGVPLRDSLGAFGIVPVSRRTWTFGRSCQPLRPGRPLRGRHSRPLRGHPRQAPRRRKEVWPPSSGPPLPRGSLFAPPVAAFSEATPCGLPDHVTWLLCASHRNSFN